MKLMSVEGKDPEAYKGAPIFDQLTPIDPRKWLNLETIPDRMTTRVVDMFCPIGMGTRGLIVAPLFDVTPVATACVEIPFWNSDALVWHRFATVLSTDWLLITCPTDDGFVCGFVTWAPPLGVYGWPR